MSLTTDIRFKCIIFHPKTIDLSLSVQLPKLKLGMRHSIKHLVSIIIFTGYIMIAYGFGLYIFPALVPEMRATYNFEYHAIGTIMALNQMAYIIFSYLSGWLSLSVGSLVLVGLSILICSVCMILIGIVDHFWLLGTLFIINGACAAAAWVPIVNIVNRFVPEKHLSKTMGFISSGTSYGIFMVGFAIPMLVEHYQWHFVWIFFGCGSLCFFILSTMFFVFSFPLSMYFETSTHKKPDKLTDKAFCTPLDKHKIFFLMIIMFLTGMSFIPFQTYLMPYIREDIHFPIEVGGYVLNIIGLLGIISGLAIGMLADRYSIRQTLLIIYALIFSSAALLSFFPYKWSILVSASFFGISYFGTFGLIPTYISKVISKRRSAFVFGICNFALGTGSSIGNYLGGWSHQYNATFRWIYISICLICTILFLIVSLELENEKNISNLLLEDI